MKINITNTTKINAALTIAQHRCTARTMTSQDLNYHTQDIEEWLKGILYKKDWLGLRIDIHSEGGKMPASYRGIPMCTYITIERFKSGWFMVGCGRTRLVQRNQTIFPQNLPSKTKEIIDYLNRGPL